MLKHILLGSALTTATLAITPVLADFQSETRRAVVFTRSFTVDALGLLPDPPVLSDIPGFGVVRILRCAQSNNTNQIGVQFLSAADSQPFLGVSSVIADTLPLGVPQPPPPAMERAQLIDFDARIFEPDLGPPLIAARPVLNASPGMAAKWDFQLSRLSPVAGADVNAAHVSVSGFFEQNVLQCHVTAMTVLQR
jgi:hypothetical protein